MRIISGELKGRKLKSIKIEGLRPATGRYRETLFNILNNLIVLKNLKVCDLYAGTGSVGFECLSRGASHCTFVEKNRIVCALIKENAKNLQVENKITIMNYYAEKFTLQYPKKFDLIFADPPYFNFDIYKTYNNIINREMLNKNGILIIQRSRKSKDEDMKIFSTDSVRLVGDDAIYIFKF